MKLPLKFPIQHSLATNTLTTSLIIRLEDAGGLAGHGEGVPRPYVTGETLEAAQAFIQESAAPLVVGRALAPEETLGLLMRELPRPVLDAAPAAACALETALLDLAARRLGRPLSALMGGEQRQEVVYSAVIPFTEPELFDRLLGQVKALGMQEVKLKVGLPDDLERLARLRQVLGPGVRLRVDANGCWQAAEAIERIQAMAPYGVEAVEQPVAPGEAGELARVRRAVEPLVLADESLCTPDQAEALIAARAVDGFNLRLSKCGGPARTLALLETALGAGLKAQLGSQVGELGLLSALGRHMACARGELVYLEGSLAKYYVQGDVVAEDLSFGYGGRAPALPGPGLGVTVQEEALQEFKLFELNR